MRERRVGYRMLCADLVTVHWRDARGRSRKAVANLEDISPRGACLELAKPLEDGRLIRIIAGTGELCARVRHIRRAETGYLHGVEFEPGQVWSADEFLPQHLLDPRSLKQEEDADRYD